MRENPAEELGLDFSVGYRAGHEQNSDRTRVSGRMLDIITSL
jgi:hypothetical protein